MNKTKSDSSSGHGSDVDTANASNNPGSTDHSASNPGTANSGPASNERMAGLEPVVQTTENPVLRSRMLMSRDTSALLVIDVQETLVPHIQNHSTIVWNIRRLIDGASVLGVSAFCTEQYPKGLGGTVALLAERIKVDDEKSMFSCRDCTQVVQRLKDQGRSRILLCGIESHVCVLQSALDLVAMGFDVWVAVDAVGSRYELDHETALRRMEMAGVSLTTTETALFEWCEVSGTHEFKRISSLVREMPPEVVDIPDARFFPRPSARYAVQTNHREISRDENEQTVQLHFLVRRTENGSVIHEYAGQVVHDVNNPSTAIRKQGTQSVEVSADGTTISIQNAAGEIQMVYLPIGDARTNHPRWKIRKKERHIASEQYKNDYEITFQVVEYKTDQTFREFTGYEHRDPDSGGFTLVSGVRQIEISSDGRWMVVTELGRPPGLIELPPE